MLGFCIFLKVFKYIAKVFAFSIFYHRSKNILYLYEILFTFSKYFTYYKSNLYTSLQYINIKIRK